MAINEKYYLHANKNRVLAGAGCLIATIGAATLVWGWGLDSSANAALNNDKTSCSDDYDAAACEQLPTDHQDMDLAIQTLGNAVVLGAIGGATIFAAYYRDKQPMTPTSINLSFETEYQMLVDDELPQATDVRKELP